MTMVLPFNLIEGLIFAVSFWLLYVLLKPTLKHYERDKQTFLMKGSFAFYFRPSWLHMVKFYPETLVGFDQPLQTALRGDLPDYLTVLFRALRI